jgi:hypothetical protein
MWFRRQWRWFHRWSIAHKLSLNFWGICQDVCQGHQYTTPYHWRDIFWRHSLRRLHTLCTTTIRINRKANTFYNIHLLSIYYCVLCYRVAVGVSRRCISFYTIYIFILWLDYNSFILFFCKFVENAKDVIVVVIVVGFERIVRIVFTPYCRIKKKCISLTHVPRLYVLQITICRKFPT